MLNSPQSFGEGDTRLVLNVLPDEVAVTAFEGLLREVKWQQMFHRGGEVPRLVGVEGEVDEDGSFPIYCHPADESPPLYKFSPTVELIKQHVENHLPDASLYPLNHVLIQHYRHGGDYISEHSDKTIDVVLGSSIVNVSIGAQRTMTLRTKKDALSQAPDDHDTTTTGIAVATQSRSTQRIPLPHNSMLVMGLSTNAKWLHSIRTDKRPSQTKSEPERAYNEQRISLTFRCIGTFLNKEQTLIWGQGATSKLKENAKPTISGTEKAELLLAAFGEENHTSDFNWEATYGEGSDVLHFSPR